MSPIGLAAAAAPRMALALPVLLLLAGQAPAGQPGSPRSVPLQPASPPPASPLTASPLTASPQPVSPQPALPQPVRAPIQAQLSPEIPVGIPTLPSPSAAVASPQEVPSPAPCRAPDHRSPLPPPDRALAAAPPPLSAEASPRATPAVDYRAQLSPSPWGWVHLRRWCVWVEPAAAGEHAAAIRERAWLAAVEAALAQWQTLVRIDRSDDPDAAQVRVWRRRPPLRPGPDGRPRASHGRAQLQLLIAESGGGRWIEPRVDVWIGPGQGPLGLQATALHELGHAFGLWGHSPDPGDAMAAVPGARPVLVLSERDRASLRWLQAQPTRIGGPAPAPALAPAGGP